MSLQSRSEAVGTPSRVPEWVWKRVPFYQTRNGESPTTKRAAAVSCNHQLVTVGRSKALAAWDVGCTRAVVHQLLLRSLVLQTPVNYDSEFMLNTLRNVQPECLNYVLVIESNSAGMAFLYAMGNLPLLLTFFKW